jgi:hypothetical protein
VQYFVGIVSDSLILANLVDELADRTGPLQQVAYREDLRRLTGIPEIDAALEYEEPVIPLLEYLTARREHDGQEAVIHDLEVAVNAVAPGSPVHSGLSGWLERARAGEPLQ